MTLKPKRKKPLINLPCLRRTLGRYSRRLRREGGSPSEAEPWLFLDPIHRTSDKISTQDSRLFVVALVASLALTLGCKATQGELAANAPAKADTTTAPEAELAAPAKADTTTAPEAKSADESASDRDMAGDGAGGEMPAATSAQFDCYEACKIIHECYGRKDNVCDTFCYAWPELSKQQQGVFLCATKAKD